MSNNNNITTSNGAPVDDNQHSLTVGPNGPVLLQDFHLIDKLAHFDRERIPERVVHAKGAGAHGYFEVTSNDVKNYCKANFLSRKGKRTPVFVRFSTVGGEKGSSDVARDPRGFAVKFYTEEGNYDLVGNNTPVFFIRDAIKFPDFIHTQKRNPQTNLADANMVWDFWSQHPESLHQVTILFSDRGIPDGYRHMNGYGSHTFKWVNSNSDAYWVKYHFKTESGIKNLTTEEAEEIQKGNLDYSTADLFNHIENGGVAAWKVCVQIMPYEDASTYKFNPFDVTKVWPHEDYPLIEIGRMVLNRNPANYFAEVEQSAFSPSHFVPGIEPSPDKMLQGRLFSYPDTHRHRLGVNYQQIPINCPYAARLRNHQRDGNMTVDGNGGSSHNYDPNSFGGPKQAGSSAAIKPFKMDNSLIKKYVVPIQDIDYYQAGQLYSKVLNDDERERLCQNLAGSLKGANKEIQIKQVQHFLRANQNYGRRIAELLNLDLNSIPQPSKL
eukprot:TRINITY_DN3853_c0_g1_i1.p1 TRINITY_DN3853_c0_g1~~TRINITY_DN3853_c0_g1_i1.p1  ORF type:complete len:495 (+),score=202.00 TRINITY_DN3853_c0_g1_i1:65-1549(+)